MAILHCVIIRVTNESSFLFESRITSSNLHPSPYNFFYNDHANSVLKCAQCGLVSESQLVMLLFFCTDQYQIWTRGGVVHPG